MRAMKGSKERREIRSSSSSSDGGGAMVMKRRMQGLKKKLHEFTSLCEVDAWMIALYGSNGEVHTWPENQPSLDGVIERFMSIDKAERDKHAINLSEDVLISGEEKYLRELVSSLGKELEKVGERAAMLLEKDSLQAEPLPLQSIAPPNQYGGHGYYTDLLTQP